MKVFVTGATGFVGHHLLGSLKNAGHEPHALVRKGSEKKLPFTDGVEIVHGDLLDGGSWTSALEKADAVIHLVGIIREFPLKGITFERMHFEATRAIVDAAKACGIKKYSHMSANGASENGVSGYQTTKWQSEKLVENSGMDYTIFRPSVIFGDPHGRKEFTTELAKPIRSAPIMPFFGDGTYKLEPVAVEDVAECFTKSLTEPKASRRIFHLGGGEAFEYKRVLQIIGAALGKRNVRTVNAPFGLVKPFAALLQGFEFFPVTVDQINMLSMGNVCPEHDFINVFGVSPKKFSAENLGYLRRS